MMKNKKLISGIILLLTILVGALFLIKSGINKPTLTYHNIDPTFLGKYFEPHAAVHYIILNPDGTFIHNRIDSARNAKLVGGNFFINGSKIKFVYDDKYPDLNLDISHPDTYNWYITGTVGNWGYYFVHQDTR